MKVCILDRTHFYKLLSACFGSVQVKPRIIELGVLKGDNAEIILNSFDPASLILIDSWSTNSQRVYIETNERRAWVDDLNGYAPYYGGLLTQQETFDRLFRVVEDRFSKTSCVQLIRANTADASQKVKELVDDSGLFHLIYVDANHQYESVLDDLMTYKDYLHELGAFQLNDCCHSSEGVKQNLGVLEAVVKFTKMADFVPVALTNTDWSDLILVRKRSQLVEILSATIVSNDVIYVEIPDQLLGASRVISGKRSNLSFI